MAISVRIYFACTMMVCLIEGSFCLAKFGRKESL
jgi:hypothetical protein